MEAWNGRTDSGCWARIGWRWPVRRMGHGMLEYFRYPVLLREKPEDGDLVDCPPECAGAVACYAAAQLAALDDASLQAALYNEFENRLSRLGELPVANREEIGNMYGGWEAVE